jgi:hypothetical protein
MMMMGSPRKVASLIVAKKLGGSIDRASQLRGESEEMLEQMNPAQDEGKVALVEAAQKLVSGMESKSPELIAKAFHTMFRLVEMMPHEEYHEEIEEAVEGY